MLSFLHSLTNEVPLISSTMKNKLPAVGFFTLLLCMLPLEGFTQWESIKGPYGGSISNLAKNDHYVFAGTSDGFFRSIDGKNWEALSILEGKRTSTATFVLTLQSDRKVLTQKVIIQH